MNEFELSSYKREQSRRYGPLFKGAMKDEFVADMVALAREYRTDFAKLRSYRNSLDKVLGETSRPNPEVSFIELVSLLAEFYLSRGGWKEWLVWSRDAVEASHRLGLVTFLVQIQIDQGRMLFRLGDFDGMKRALDEADRTASSGKDRRALASLLYLRGALARGLGDYEAARRYCRESLELMRQQEDQVNLGIALYNLGAAEDEEGGEAAMAVQCFEECREIFLRHHLNDRAGRATLRLARSLMQQGKPERSKSWIAEAEYLIDFENQPREFVNLLLVRAQIEARLGNVVEARLHVLEGQQKAYNLYMQKQFDQLTSLLASFDDAEGHYES